MKTFAGTLVASMVLYLGVGFAADAPNLKDEKDRISYSVGYQVGGDFKRQEVDLNPDLLVKGIRDAVEGKEPLMTRQEMHRTLVDLKKKVVADEQRRKKEQAEQAREAGEKFLAENMKREGVVTLPSGLQYTVIEEGSGDPPKKTDTVTVHYKGTLIDGTEFDSSYSRGKPASFQVGGVIAGWTEALQKMKPGAKWRLFIPSNLAYGEQGAGSRIPPNSALIFDVELISVKAGG